ADIVRWSDPLRRPGGAAPCAVPCDVLLCRARQGLAADLARPAAAPRAHSCGRAQQCDGAAAGGLCRRGAAHHRAGRMRAGQEPGHLCDRSLEAARDPETGAEAVRPWAVKHAISATEDARGFIVVAVLWMLAALAALVLIYLTYVINTAV